MIIFPVKGLELNTARQLQAGRGIRKGEGGRLRLICWLIFNRVRLLAVFVTTATPAIVLMIKVSPPDAPAAVPTKGYTSTQTATHRVISLNPSSSTHLPTPLTNRSLFMLYRVLLFLPMSFNLRRIFILGLCLVRLLFINKGRGSCYK